MADIKYTDLSGLDYFSDKIKSILDDKANTSSLGSYAYKSGSNASGTWPISITGNAATATSATTATYATYIGASGDAYSKADLYNLITNRVPKKHDAEFYPYIGSAHRQANYKVTLPISGYTDSTTRWMMITMELVLGGSYSSGANGKIFLSYYFLKNPSNVWVADQVRAIGIGNKLADNAVSIQYDIANPGIFYVHANNNIYSSFSIQNLSANDSAPAFDFNATTIEAVSSIPTGLTNVPLTCIDSKGDNKLYVNNTAVSLDGHGHGYWTWNENTIKGVKVNNAGYADSAGSATDQTARDAAAAAQTTANGKWTYNASTIAGVKVNNASNADNAGIAERLGKTWKEDINYTYGSGSNLKIISNNTGTAGNFASGWQSGISVISDYVGWQLTSCGGGEQNPYFRSLQDNGTWKPWRTLMFTDDNISWSQITNKPAVGIKNIFKLLANGSNNSAGSNGRNAYMDLTPLNQDSYFFIKLSEDIAVNETLVFSFDVSGVEKENFLWQWCWNNQSTEGMITITGNRRYYMNVTNKNAVAAGTNILIDDWVKDFKGQTSKIRLSNFKVSRGTECSDYIHNNDNIVLNNCDNTINGILTIAPTNKSAHQDGLVLHDGGGGGSEALRIRWTSGSYTDGVTLVGRPDTNSLEFNGNVVYHAGNLTKKIITDLGIPGTDTNTWPTKSDLGLGNVDNTADANKNVNYANTAGSATVLYERFWLDRNHDSDVILPKDLPAGITTQFTNKTGAGSGYTWNTVVTMNAYPGETSSGAGYRHQLLFPNSYDSGNSFYYRKGADSTWDSTWKTVLHSGNSSVSGGGSSWGSSITVNIAGTEKTLTIPSKPTYTHSDVGAAPASHAHSDTFLVQYNPNYVALSFRDDAIAKIAGEKYIECWDSAGGWWNWKANKWITIGGTSSNFVKGDGSLDSNSYALSSHSHDYLPFYQLASADCNTMSQGLTAVTAAASNQNAANHSAFLTITNIGTPFQLQIPDSSEAYVYKRYKSGGSWSAWSKLSAGYADSSGSASTASKLGNYSESDFAHRADVNNLMHSGNEFTYAAPAYSGDIWHNYRTSSWSTDGGIANYRFGNGAGGYASVHAAAFYQSSDERLKTFYEPVDIDIKALKKLRKSYFKFNDSDHTQIGVSAQEIKEIYPEIVSENTDGYLSVAYDKLSVVALAAVDKLDNEIDELKERIQKLEKIIEKLV